MACKFYMLCICILLAGCVNHMALNGGPHDYRKFQQPDTNIIVRADILPLKRVAEKPVKDKGSQSVSTKKDGGLTLPTEPTRSDVMLSLTRPIFFELDVYQLTPAQQEQLRQLATFMMQLENQNLKIRIEGHCDDRGTRDYNFALGSRRASSVSDVLRFAGVSPQRIKSVSYGKERPAYLGNSASARAQNRRADLLMRPDFSEALRNAVPRDN